MNSTKTRSYLNTLVFAIIAGIISVLLLFVLMFKKLREFTPFVITLEVGIFLVLFSCIGHIWIIESRLGRLRNQGISSIGFDSCPDYYVKRLDGSKEFCSNEYVLQDEYGKSFIMKVYPANTDKVKIPLPTSHEQSMSTNTDKPYDKFYLREIESDMNLKTPADKCAPLFSQPSDPKLAYLNGFNRLPWSTMRSKCEAVAA